MYNIPEKVLITAKRVKEIVKSIDPTAKVYLFGSATRGELTALSDIDILVLTERTNLKYEIMVKVYKNVKEPIELHVVNEKYLEVWYKRFIRSEELIEV
ncbi:MAG: nucleotidyltransferase domain-containing protein [Candidatus Bathyarchaeia archaeon]|nr:nucleotidyltransferase domain-containing protein [Candidatus Bathyarchaeota archaeon]